MSASRVSPSTLAVDVSTDELWFLLGQFGPAVILGIENPYLGWLADEIEKAQRAALLALVDRDLVRTLSPTEIALDEVLAKMVRTCAQAQHSLIVQSQTADRKNSRRHIHFGPLMIVEHWEIEPGRHRLTAIQDRPALIDHLSGPLRAESKSVSQGDKFQLDESRLLEARQFCLAGKSRKAVVALQTGGLSADLAHRLVQALSDPVANTSVVTIVNRTHQATQHVRGLALLEGQGEMWLMSPFDRNGSAWVEFASTQAVEVQQRFRTLLP